ncbi:hypothetical protein [Paenibacillus sp. FSL K6-1558]|uniref:hypothetical protein n=1 Tax=Paenibacillus sp. FSL K6-1558 TaxID=2921473 RepID=UPI0030F615DF
MSSITIGGTLGELAEKAKKELKKLKIKDVNDFFEKLGNDIDHLPQDVKKAIKDTEEELKRLNINFNELLENGFDSMKEIFEKIPTPEEFAREMALSFANRVKEDTKDDTSIKLCNRNSRRTFGCYWFNDENCIFRCSKSLCGLSYYFRSCCCNLGLHRSL